MNEINRMISSLISHTFLLILCTSDTVQNMIGFGSCPDFNATMKDFDVAQYMGLWFQQYRRYISPEISTSCTQVNLTNSEEGSLLYQITYFNSWNDEYETVTGTAKFEAQDSEGKFLLNFSDKGKSSVKTNILDTDYNSYSVVWSCENKRGYNLRNIWIFTREQYPLNDALQKALAALKELNLPIKLLIKSDQSNCIKPNIEYELETDPDAEYVDDKDLKINLQQI